VPIRWPARWHEVRWPTPITRFTLTWPDFTAGPTEEAPAPPLSEDGFD
jgi:hypothetical protein